MTPDRQQLDELHIDDLVFAVRRSSRRRTIGITVERDGSLRLAVPSRCSRRRLEEAVRGKLPWVRGKLAAFAAMGPPPEPPRFVDGERLPYLGRSYRLALVDGAEPLVALRRGRFELSRACDGEARAAFVDWYTARAREVLERKVELWAPVVDARPQAVRVRTMKSRWGTCHSRTHVVDFNWELVLLPPRIIDYVVVHELSHLHRADHSPAFWRRVEGVLPRWREARRWLRTEAPRVLP